MRRRPCVIAVIENGEIRCGLTNAYTGLGGIPYRLLKGTATQGEQARPLFESMKCHTEVSPEKYQNYLDHPESADDFSAMIEIDLDQNIIRVDEDMGEEREYHEFPLDALLEQAKQLRSPFTKQGSNVISQKRIYRAMKDFEAKPPEQGMTMGGLSQ